MNILLYKVKCLKWIDNLMDKSWKDFPYLGISVCQITGIIRRIR